MVFICRFFLLIKFEFTDYQLKLCQDNASIIIKQLIQNLMYLIQLNSFKGTFVV